MARIMAKDLALQWIRAEMFLFAENTWVTCSWSNITTLGHINGTGFEAGRHMTKHIALPSIQAAMSSSLARRLAMAGVTRTGSYSSMTPMAICNGNKLGAKREMISATGLFSTRQTTY